MNSWYIDRSKNFIYDTLKDCLKVFYDASKGKTELNVNELIDIIKKHPELNIAEGNINAALTRFRDHGMINNKNIIGDSAVDYLEGRLNEEELIIDLFIKRPAEKQNSVNIKPFVLICKIFDIMIEAIQDIDDIFLTSFECKEYLCNINSIDEVSYELVEKIVNERNYSITNQCLIPRVKLETNEDTNFSIWFNALNNTPIFIKVDRNRNILRPNIKQREFFRYISENIDEISVTPTDSNTNLYNYYCNRNTGINEILPNIMNERVEEIDESKIKSIFEYLFGYRRDSKVKYEKYFKMECFGLFFPFITIPGLAIRKIYFCNQEMGELLYRYIKNNSLYIDYLQRFERGEFEYHKIIHYKKDEENKEKRGNELMKDKYEKWLYKQGFKKSTIKNYVNSISLTSREAIEDGILNKSIYDVCDLNELIEINEELLKNERFLIRKNKYNHINTAAMKNYIEFIENEETEKNIIQKPYTKDDFLNEVFIEESMYDTIVSLLEKKKNIILEGAPGVGKTFMAKRLAYSVLGVQNENNVKIIQFHQSYSYEDFIEGYKPTEEGFELTKGIFYKVCKEAELNSEENYYLIIDEINRGNLSKIFGELLMLIECDKRNEKMTLVYSNEKFFIPENLYIIGLMNTADRSLALIDYALRRRFSFIRIEPAFNNQKFINAFKEKFDQDYNRVIDIIKKINDAIEDDKSLGAGFKIGHSYFCPNLKDRKGTKKDLLDIIRFEIIPLLEEYWYDNPDSIIQWKDALNGVLDD